MTRVLELFNRWFSSTAGVYQTLVLTAAIVVWERLNPSADPNGFWLLYALTVYSGVTQNILAYGNRRTSDRTDAILDLLVHMISDESIVDRRTYDLLERGLNELRTR
ncbi:hypothetical protein [Mycobacterium malmoense]|uniref:hypothetical protein n=1 Tax=Mycobacterium malmoense TaxID=1780 RepID=UPI0008F92A1F|nr:hypothetical protein [Mycobacterium malmoense]OIN80858.1 hypothetical protein BMG05_11020 [Mycobacterium malmoense]